MTLQDTINKRLTNIYSFYQMEVVGLDEGECFLELENKYIIGIPFGFTTDTLEKPLRKNVIKLFDDLSDIPIHHFNKDGKSILDIIKSQKIREKQFLWRVLKFLFGIKPPLKEYKVYKTEYRENELKYLKDQKIIDFIWYKEYPEKGFFQLENGYLISEINFSPHGTGAAGLNYYKNIEEFGAEPDEITRLSEYQHIDEK